MVQHGGRIIGFGADVFRSAIGGRCTSILRDDLAHAIHRLVADDVETIFGDSVTALAEDAEGVQVTFERHPPRRFDLVVGADGLHSAVRAIAFGAEERFAIPLGYGTAAFSAPHYPHRDEGAYVSYTVRGRQIARYALRDYRSAFCFMFVAERAPGVAPHDVAAQRRVLRDALHDIGWEADEILAEIEQGRLPARTVDRAREY